MPDNNNDKYQVLSDVTEAVENPSPLQEVADMKLRLINALGTISAGPYTPAVLADWDGSADPGDIDGALDQLAERVKDVEGGAITIDASVITYAPANDDNYGGSDPGNTDDALDNIASRTTASEADIVALQTAINSIISNGGNPQVLSQIIAGGELIWLQDLDFLVTGATYYVNGTLHTSLAQEVTLDAADMTDPRIDVVALDDTGTAIVITGIPDTNPSEPDIDPATQVQVGFVFVDANATEPVVTKELIYAENTGESTEWTSSVSGSGFNANSSNNPKSGTKCIEGTTVANNAYVQLANDATLDPNTYTFLLFYIRSKATWNANRFLRIQFQTNGVKEGAALTLGHGYYGFDSSNTTDYQGIAIPISSFGITAGHFINQIRFTDNGGSIGFYIDDISIQTSNQIVQKLPPPTIPGSVDKAVQYNDNGVFGGESGFEYDKATNTLSLPLLSLAIGANITFNIETIAGTKTLTNVDPRYQSLATTGAQNVDMPAEANGIGAWFIANRGPDIITVRNDAAGTIDTIDADEGLSLMCDGTRWISAKATLVIV